MREKISNLELLGGTGVPPVGHAQDARATSGRVNPHSRIFVVAATHRATSAFKRADAEFQTNPNST